MIVGYIVRNQPERERKRQREILSKGTGGAKGGEKYFFWVILMSRVT